ncbi:MAG: hypothetical protein GQF41_4291 [Candidatus Rifleibacterium amylolyticum]|nr:MAG: hypothetical protein GQF41_4291 [Candidatus Rifleibacterium amylolyticum]
MLQKFLSLWITTAPVKTLRYYGFTPLAMLVFGPFFVAMAKIIPKHSKAVLI